MTEELARVIQEKGRDLKYVPRAPIGTYHQRLSLELRTDEMLIACWGTQFPTTIGPICEKVANNPFKDIDWIYAISRNTADEILVKRGFNHQKPQFLSEVFSYHFSYLALGVKMC